MTPLDFACAAQFQASGEPQLLAQLAEKSATSISLNVDPRSATSLRAGGSWCLEILPLHSEEAQDAEAWGILMDFMGISHRRRSSHLVL